MGTHSLTHNALSAQERWIHYVVGGLCGGGDVKAGLRALKFIINLLKVLSV
jgi:hypothetical protein